MGEDSEITVKKRRKITSVSSVSTEITKPVDVYQRVVDFEEAEARQRSAEKDAALFHKFCEDIRQLLAEIAELKTKNTSEACQEIASKRIQATLTLVALKKLNRLEKIRTKAGRDALHKEKQRLDSTHLLLQNLHYETDHLEKEVTKCLQFKSKDEEIVLVPVEEFYKDAPKDVSRPEVTKKDSHQLRLARLQWELQQRQKLTEACNQLGEGAQAVSSSLAASRARLHSLSPRLREALAAAQPLREALGLSSTGLAGGARGPVSLLPLPLFLLHARVQAYTEAFRHRLVQVAISGDEDDARRLEQEGESLNLFQDSESDQDPKEEEDNQDKKKRHHRSGTKTAATKQERADEKLKLVTKSHPLVVKLTVKFDEASLTLTFSYLINLKIVTVQSSIEIQKPSGVSSADVLNSQSILSGLYPKDFGADSPHPATGYILRSAGVDKEFSAFIPKLGQPYVWAQRMCGLDFLASSIDGDKPGPLSKMQNEPCPNLSSISVENVLIVLQKRLKARISLMKELQDLESLKIPPFEVTGSSQVHLPGSLTRWQAISWSEYGQAASVKELLTLGLVTQHDMFYRAIITRQSAKLIALVCLKSDYPKESPIFSLTLHWNGAHHAGTDDDIRDIERCVNTDWCIPEGSKSKITLTGQLTRLLCCLDILLEAVGSSEFPPKKLIFRPVKGRNRVKPYKYLKQGSGVFTQF